MISSMAIPARMAQPAVGPRPSQPPPRWLGSFGGSLIPGAHRHQTAMVRAREGSRRFRRRAQGAARGLRRRLHDRDR
jgi:hypothetical protein